MNKNLNFKPSEQKKFERMARKIPNRSEVVALIDAALNERMKVVPELSVVMQSLAAQNLALVSLLIDKGIVKDQEEVQKYFDQVVQELEESKEENKTGGKNDKEGKIEFEK